MANKKEYVTERGVFAVELAETTNDIEGPQTVSFIFNDKVIESYDCESIEEAAFFNNVMIHDIGNVLKCLNIEAKEVLYSNGIKLDIELLMKQAEEKFEKDQVKH